MSRLTIDTTDQQHQQLKAMGALQGKTIREYAIEKLFPRTSDESAAFRELKNLLEQRLAEVAEGSVSTERVTEIAEGEMQAGAEAWPDAMSSHPMSSAWVRPPICGR